MDDYGTLQLADIFPHRADRRWMIGAACAGMDPNIFVLGHGKPARRAKLVCSRCPVTTECLQYAREIGERDLGVYGGLTPRERRGMTIINPTNQPTKGAKSNDHPERNGTDPKAAAYRDAVPDQRHISIDRAQVG